MTLSDEAKGFMSIIQYCPDPSRQECANVGLVMAVPSLGYFKVALSEDNAAPKARFGATSFDEELLDAAKRAIASRLTWEGRQWSSAADLVAFAGKEGDHTVLTPLRTVMVLHAEAEFAEYFARLVDLGPKEATHGTAERQHTVLELWKK